MTKRIPRDSALPRRRSAPALALQSPRHRQQVISDKRRRAIARRTREEIDHGIVPVSNEASERRMNEETRATALGLDPLGVTRDRFLRTLADDLQLESAALHRRVIDATAPKSMSLDEARQLSARIASIPEPDGPTTGLDAASREASKLSNTLCPKIGAAQWTCTRDECTCHLKESIGIRRHGAAIACATATRRPSYEDAVKHRPPGACYCDLDDRACYAAGHWEPACSGVNP